MKKLFISALTAVLALSAFSSPSMAQLNRYQNVDPVWKGPATDIGNGAIAANTSTVLSSAGQWHGIRIQNRTTGDCYLGGDTATQDFHSLKIPTGGYYESTGHAGQGNVSINCTAAGAVYGRRW